MERSFQLRRPFLRLSHYDYTKIGAYFVTVCTENRNNLFGKIEHGSILLNNLGEIVQQEWLQISNLRDNVELDEFMVMLNHFHAILFITQEMPGTASRAPIVRRFGKPVSGSLSAIIGGFKSGVAWRINRLGNSHLSGLWQRSFFEHVIRTEESLDRIREYIATNPLRWELDRENPHRQGDDDFDRWMSHSK